MTKGKTEGGQSGSPTNTELQQNRFLLFTITYLLCSPSDFADEVNSGGDLDTWFKKAGLDTNDASSRRREICLDFVNRIKQSPVAYPLMCALRVALQSLIIGVFGFYDHPPCPNAFDSAHLFAAAAAIDPKK